MNYIGGFFQIFVVELHSVWKYSEVILPFPPPPLWPKRLRSMGFLTLWLLVGISHEGRLQQENGGWAAPSLPGHGGLAARLH